LRIAYILSANLDINTGVYKKIRGQANTWVANRHDVKIFLISSANEKKNPSVLFTSYQQFEMESLRTFSGAKSAFIDLYSFVQDIIDWKPDIIYMRYMFYYPALGRLLKNVPTIIEINTDDVSEFPLISKPQHLYNICTRNCLLGQASGFVFVTNELSKNVNFSKFNKPYIVLGNGIDLTHINPLVHVCQDKTNITFMGSPGYTWHGVDKIIKLANHLPDFVFHIIGYSNDQTKKPIPPNVICYGYINREQYETVLEMTDVCLGSMALHRNGLMEASPLKVREYLGYGLPVIIAYHDTDFLDPPEFILEIPNEEDNIQGYLGEIVQFINQVKGKQVPQEAIIHLDVKQKEIFRLNFFARIQTNRLSEENQ
jgi:hypothetical protein